MKRRNFLGLACTIIEIPRAAAAQQADADVTVAQSFESLLNLPLYVALRKKFFAKHGLSVTTVTASSGANAVAEVISGSATFSLQDPMTAALANLKGAKVKNIAAAVDGLPVWIVVRNDSPIKDVRDLNGKTIATAIRPSPSTYLLEMLLKRDSIDATVSEVLIGSEIAPLLAGKADAAVVYEPYVELAVAQGARVMYSFSSSVKGGYAFSSITAREDLLRTDPTLVRNFVNGFNDALAYIRANQTGTIEVAIEEFPSMSATVVRAAMRRMTTESIFPANAIIQPSAFANAVTLQVAVGNVKPGSITYDQAVDPTFASR